MSAYCEGLPTRPLMRYHGGKWRIAPWIIEQMPRHCVYVEPFGGSASVLLRKNRIAAEVYNDLDHAVVNVFRVLQDPVQANQLRRRLYFTTFSRAEFNRCYEPATDSVDAAAKAIVLSFFGFGTDSITRTNRTGFRARLSDERALPSQHWRNWSEGFDSYIDRLRGVTIESCPAVEVIQRYDAADALFYCDPPYVISTRSSMRGKVIGSHGYRHELLDDDHEALAEQLHGLKGMVLLSGYRSVLYDSLYAGWKRIERVVRVHSSAERTECLWLSPKAVARSEQISLGLTFRGVSSIDLPLECSAA